MKYSAKIRTFKGKTEWKKEDLNKKNHTLGGVTYINFTY